MEKLILHDLHAEKGASFTESGGGEVVTDYGDPENEFKALRHHVGVSDLSHRGRLVLLGADRIRFLHGQVTQDIKSLQIGQGAYAALTTNKGKIQVVLHVYVLEEEILLDFDAGLETLVKERLEKYLVADDVQVIDAKPHYSLIPTQGPGARPLLEEVGMGALPESIYRWKSIDSTHLGKTYVMNCPRGLGTGFDLFVPNEFLSDAWTRFAEAAQKQGGRLVGETALDRFRILGGWPRFGVDMSENNLAPEAGLDRWGISYTKGCYIGQEVLNRLRTFAQVSRKLKRISFPWQEGGTIPPPQTRIMADGKAAGFLTSATWLDNQVFGFAYLRKEFLEHTNLHLDTDSQPPLKVEGDVFSPFVLG